MALLGCKVPGDWPLPLAVCDYRFQAWFSAFQARTLLGIQSRNEMDGFLKVHGVFLDLTLEDVQKDTDAALASSR